MAISNNLALLFPLLNLGVVFIEIATPQQVGVRNDSIDVFYTSVCKNELFNVNLKQIYKL